MTDSAVQSAQRALPNRQLEGWTSFDGPAAIQGEADGQAAVGPLLELVTAADTQGAEAIIIGCADDTGLEEARSLARCPVIGIGQAAYEIAHLRGRPYAVVTTLAVSVPVLEENIRRGGYDSHCRTVRASGIAVLELETDHTAPERLLQTVREEQSAGAESIVLGCAGMTAFAEFLYEETGLAFVDGVTAAAYLADAVLKATSPVGTNAM